MSAILGHWGIDRAPLVAQRVTAASRHRELKHEEVRRHEHRSFMDYDLGYLEGPVRRRVTSTKKPKVYVDKD